MASNPWPSLQGGCGETGTVSKVGATKGLHACPQSNRSAAHPVNRRSSPHCWGHHAHSGKWRHSKRSRPSRREETPKEGFPTRLLRRAPGQSLRAKVPTGLQPYDTRRARLFGRDAFRNPLIVRRLSGCVPDQASIVRGGHSQALR
jgi:hypothetical protein